MGRSWTPASRDPEEFHRQCVAAVAAGAASAALGSRATSARFDASARALVLQLRDGTSVAVPVSGYPELAQLQDDVIQFVRVTRSGYGLQWDSEDLHLAVRVVLGSVRHG